jgi:spore germination protein (amino acid permease)
MTFIGLKNHVIIISPLIKSAGRDAWMTVVITFFLTLLWIPLLIFINKKTKGEHLFQWISKRAGKGITNILLTFILLYLAVIQSVTLRETITWVNITFLPNTPQLVLIASLGLVCFFLATTSLRTISIVNVFLLFFIVLLGFFVAFTNLQVKDYSLLQPFLEHGISPVLKSIVFQGSGMIELLLLLFLQHKVDGRIRYKHLVITSFLLTGLTIGPLIGAIIEFGPLEASKQRFPPYEEWGLATLGMFIEHVDFLSIYQWMAGTFIRLSLFLFIMKELLPFKKGHNWFLVGVIVVITGITLYPMNDFTYSEIVFSAVLPTTFWFFLGLSLLLAVVVAWFANKRRRA